MLFVQNFIFVQNSTSQYYMQKCQRNIAKNGYNKKCIDPCFECFGCIDLTKSIKLTGTKMESEDYSQFKLYSGSSNVFGGGLMHRLIYQRETLRCSMVCRFGEETSLSFRSKQ